MTGLKTKIVPCLNCKKGIVCKPRSLNKYCSIKCQQEFFLKDRISKWFAGDLKQSNRWLRRALTFLRGYFCQVCGLTNWNGKSIVLEVEHKDGNSSNNHPDNVCLICPNCHSQTETYKGANRGFGRYTRRQRYAENKSY